MQQIGIQHLEVLLEFSTYTKVDGHKKLPEMMLISSIINIKQKKDLRMIQLAENYGDKLRNLINFIFFLFININIYNISYEIIFKFKL